MSVQHEFGMYLEQDPHRVFAVLDDLEHTPDWLKACTGMEKLTEGENHVGTKLKYTYKDGNKSISVSGKIVARTPNERISIVFSDDKMDTSIDYRISNTGAGSHVVHAIEVTPKTFFAKIAASGMRPKLEQQAKTTLTNLRSYLNHGQAESAGPASVEQ